MSITVKKEVKDNACMLAVWPPEGTATECNLANWAASGDPAYPLMVHLQGPFRNAHLTPQMQHYNKSMSEVRTFL